LAAVLHDPQVLVVERNWPAGQEVQVVAVPLHVRQFVLQG